MLLRKNRMLEVIRKLKMRQVDVARIIGISPTHLSHVLAGRRRLTMKQSKLLIEIFGAEIMSRVIDWDGMGIQNPLVVAR